MDKMQPPIMIAKPSFSVNILFSAGGFSPFDISFKEKDSFGIRNSHLDSIIRWPSCASKESFWYVSCRLMRYLGLTLQSYSSQLQACAPACKFSTSCYISPTSLARPWYMQPKWRTCRTSPGQVACIANSSQVCSRTSSSIASLTPTSE